MIDPVEYIVVFITTSSQKEAEILSERLIENKLAACVNSMPVNSIFTWKEKLEKSPEVLLIVKSKRILFEKLEQLIKQYHSYEVPEIIALPIISGSKNYLDWIKETTANG